jgi:thiosulfate dehydrogenase
MRYADRLFRLAWRHFPAPLGLTLIAVVLLASPVAADKEKHLPPGVAHYHDLTDVWAIAQGGRLYDDWAKVVFKTAPKTTHPAYPAAGREKEASTWRCTACHGWDYKGAKGAYGKGSHYTGVKGIRDMVGVDPKVIHKILMDDTHRYTEEHMPHGAMEMIALFVSRGQIDVDLYIDRASKKSRGDSERGARFFQTICANCHGHDGKGINFGTRKNPKYIGTVAREDPQRLMHKARCGQPGTGMVSLITQPAEVIADILAYAQTLPEK